MSLERKGVAFPDNRCLKQGGDVAEDIDEFEACAICFEQKEFIALPCACKVNYCASCWDHALAASVAARGRACCPSCRASLRVDYDPVEGRLTFAASGEALVDDWRAQVYGKARPVQIQLLQRYGQDLAERAAAGAHGDSEKPAASIIGIAHACEPHADQLEGVVPVCVCGAEMERMSSKQRIERMLYDTDPNFASHFGTNQDELVERLMKCALVTCDLCQQLATRTGACWTCKNGQNTILHPASYDVCEACFEQYAGAHSAAAARHSEGKALSASASCSASSSSDGPTATGHPHSPTGVTGCCHLGLAVLRRMLPNRVSTVGPVADGGLPVVATARASRRRRSLVPRFVSAMR